MGKVKDVWNKEVPVQKSNQVVTDKIVVYNQENFKLLPNKPVMVDLFSGAGGFSVGGEWAGFQAVLGLDYLKPAIDTWRHNHPNALSVLGDIRDIDALFIKDLLQKHGVHKVHLLTGGVPCQGFSRSNRKHNDADERNFLFLEYMKMVKVLLPDYIIIENVSGMQTTAKGKFVEDIKQSMLDLGYKPSVRLLNAADYGVPQLRKRLIFVGVRRGYGLKEEYEYPVPLYGGDNQPPYRTVYDAISDLPAIGIDAVATEYATEAKTDYQKLMRGGPCAINPKKADKLYNHISSKQSKEITERIARTRQGEALYSSFKQRRRLDYSKPSPTQVSGGIRPQAQFAHPTIPRGLTTREMARIQSFPDSYEFLGGITQERVQVGNAVPPLMMYYIAKEIIKSGFIRE